MRAPTIRKRAGVKMRRGFVVGRRNAEGGVPYDYGGVCVGFYIGGRDISRPYFGAMISSAMARFNSSPCCSTDSALFAVSK